MFDHYQNTLMSQQRQQHLHDEAEQARLAAEAAPSDAKPFYAPALNSIGHGLINLGSTLQERYGEHSQSQQPQSSVRATGSFASANVSK